MEDPLCSIYLRSSKILEKKALLSAVCSCFAAVSQLNVLFSLKTLGTPLITGYGFADVS